jgi:hypothetical protein
MYASEAECSKQTEPKVPRTYSLAHLEAIDSNLKTLIPE